MSIIADIASLEERINDLLASLPDELVPAGQRFQDSAVEAVLGILDKYSLDELKKLDLDTVVADALADALAEAGSDVAGSIASRVQTIITDTAAFYAARGISTDGLLDAAGRSQSAQEVARLLSEGMSVNRTNLQEATIEAMQDAIARGKINRTELADDIAERADAYMRHAETQATTSIASYNQSYRNELAAKAELEHFFYYGSIVARSRHFCRACAGKTFTGKQVDQMDNGMIPPVRTFRGGWNCRHSWLPVDPEWDDELKASLDEDAEAQYIELDDKGRSIKVVVNKEQAARLREQVALSRVGYDQFVDSKVNDQGFVAIHPSWRELRHIKGFNDEEYRTLHDEFDVGRILADQGDLIQLNPRIQNLRGGQSDLVWNGIISDVKTPKSTDHTALYNRIHGEDDQADAFFINMKQPNDHLPRAVGRLRPWLRRHPDKQIFLIHRYDNDRIEEVKS